MNNSFQTSQDFPLLSRRVNGKRIVYLDSTATSLKPQSVLAKLDEYYTKYTANIFRGIYKLSEEATAEYEAAREKIATFIGAPDAREVIFTRNATESLNLVMYSWARHHIKKGESIVASIMEHHSNFVPWQQWAADNGAKFDIWRADADGRLHTKDLEKLITKKTKILAVAAVSNVLGTINDIAEIVAVTKRLNPSCMVVVDAAQAVPHMPVSVHKWKADFVAFSGHKMLGPTGIGVLWGRMDVLEKMKPFLYGGEMIREVREDKTFYKEVPHIFEAGTPHIAGTIGLGAAVDYLSTLGMKNVRAHEKEITEYALARMQEIPGLRVFGPTDAAHKGGVVAFTMKEAHPHDIAQVLDEDNIYIRSGNHCAMPLHTAYGVSASARASFYVYTTKEDVDALIEGLEKVRKMFG